jgi:hypothetical protein
MDQHIADTVFADGVWRPVWQDGKGRQYVLDCDGEPVYGVWLIQTADGQPCVVVDG